MNIKLLSSTIPFQIQIENYQNQIENYQNQMRIIKIKLGIIKITLRIKILNILNNKTTTINYM